MAGTGYGPSVGPDAGASVLRLRWVVRRNTHLTPLLGPVPRLLRPAVLLQLPVLVVGAAPVLVGSEAFFTASLGSLSSLHGCYVA